MGFNGSALMAGNMGFNGGQHGLQRRRIPQMGASATISGLLIYHMGYEIYAQTNQVLANEGSSVRFAMAYPTASDLELLDQGLATHGADWWKHLFPDRLVGTASSDPAFSAALKRLTYQLRMAGRIDSHQVSTCKMGQVVDQRLNVIGVRNLKRRVGARRGGNAFTANVIGARAADFVLCRLLSVLGCVL
jgi:hypothetical protein